MREVIAVRKALESVYGKGSMVASCAEHIVKFWPEWQEEHDPVRALHIFIWNYFPGGDTAWLAAAKVKDALDQAVEVPGGPWTRHGHAVAGVTVFGLACPPRARCGGPGLCAQCAIDAERLRREHG